jgi:hypothetical protein
VATYVQTEIAGATDTYGYFIGFSYSRPTDIKVYIDGTEVSQGSGAGKYIFNAARTKVVFEDGSEPQDGETLTIKRVTDISTAVVNFTSGAGVTQADLRALEERLRYSIDELQVAEFDKTFPLTDLYSFGVLITPHPFGGDKPSRIEYFLVCTSADNGYGSGALLDLTQAALIPAMFWDTASFYVADDGWNSFNIASMSTGARVTPTFAKWSLRVRAWR